jgi:hypothetical protein
MRPEGVWVLIAGAGLGIGLPLLLALAGLVGPRRGLRPVVGWRLGIASALAATLAFNLVFILQEVFLVLPKALTPGLHPVLYHNNHTWTGDDPVAALYQGTGALVIAVVGAGALAWAALRPPRTLAARLLLVWTAFSGIYQSLMQVVVGAALPQNDVGMAMDYLGLGRTERVAAAALALVLMAAAGWSLCARVLELAGAMPEGRVGRGDAVLRAATLPGLAAIVLILPFRAPGSLDQVALVPVIVMLLGLSMTQAAAWRAAPRAGPPAGTAPLVPLLAGLALVLAVFQLVLRPGVAV